jgi:hypothetical protein
MPFGPIRCDKDIDIIRHEYDMRPYDEKICVSRIQLVSWEGCRGCLWKRVAIGSSDSGCYENGHSAVNSQLVN